MLPLHHGPKLVDPSGFEPELSLFKGGNRPFLRLICKTDSVNELSPHGRPALRRGAGVRSPVLAEGV